MAKTIRWTFYCVGTNIQKIVYSNKEYKALKSSLEQNWGPINSLEQNGYWDSENKPHLVIPGDSEYTIIDNRTAPGS